MASAWASDRPVPNIKGGGLRGGPKRWTGHGPPPARHIPWPEIFKHHISLCEGHLKMVDMVRKHTVEGSGNWRTIMGCVNRTQDMLREIKNISKTFVPPHGAREKVPLGSSSASMYPGYSPADHEYGQAAAEYGTAAAEARAQGVELKHPEAEYNIGQARGIKRKNLAAMREVKAARKNANGGDTGSGSGSNDSGNASPPRSASANGDLSNPAVSGAADGDKPFFVIDTEPTPVNISDIASQQMKRNVSSEPEITEGKKHKKTKIKHEHELVKQEEVDGVQYDDISEEVDVRLKEKEEKRKRKEEKKRKRESEGDSAAAPSATQTNGDSLVVREKPKKKKAKHSHKEVEKEPRKRSGDSEDNADSGEKKKKRKKHKTPAIED